MSQPDYKQLYGQALLHLRFVSGSRNSFSQEARERLFDPSLEPIQLRTPEVERMHREAVEFLKEHDEV